MFYKTDYRINSLKKILLQQIIFAISILLRLMLNELLPLIHLISTTTEDSRIHVENKMTRFILLTIGHRAEN